MGWEYESRSVVHTHVERGDVLRFPRWPTDGIDGPLVAIVAGKGSRHDESGTGALEVHESSKLACLGGIGT